MYSCIITSDNHSDDLIHIKSGLSYSIPVCGFHEMIMRGESTIYDKARAIAAEENQWIVFTETRDGVISATTKKSALAAKRAYNKIHGDYKTYGFARVNDAQPRERVAAGFTPFPKIHCPMT